MQTINIITPCSRPENLTKIYNSIFDNTGFFPREGVYWWVCGDSNIVIHNQHWLNFYTDYYQLNENILVSASANIKSIVGNHQRNNSLDLATLSSHNWFTFIDDDNLLHPEFYWTFYKYLLNTAPKFKAYVYAQDRRSDLGIILEPSKGIGYKKTDSSQYVVRGDLIGQTRWKEDDYNADGLFIEELYGKDPSSFFLSDKILSLRNALRS